jgi:signal transduction histidine kinase
LKNAGFEVTKETQPGLPPVLLDREAMAQAILNLLNNAIKYSADVKRIEVSAQRRGHQLAIEITDYGIGIPRSEQRKIFEKFYRVSTGLVHETKGSGLGLAIVRHIIEAHRGEILVESAPGEGSRFTILLPIEKLEGVVVTESYRPDAASTGGYGIAENPHH